MRGSSSAPGFGSTSTRPSEPRPTCARCSTSRVPASMAPVPRPIPRFIANSSQEGIPHGRFAERLTEAFAAAVGEINDLPDGVELPEQVDWFPERAWGGRVWVPASARTAGPEGTLELYGHVSYMQPE